MTESYINEPTYVPSYLRSHNPYTVYEEEATYLYTAVPCEIITSIPYRQLHYPQAQLITAFFYLYFCLLLRRLQMPLHHPLKHRLPITHHRVPVAGDDILKPPAIDPAYAPIEARPVARADDVPEHAPLPHARGVLQVAREPRRPARIRNLARPAVLLRRGEVEDQIRLQQRARWPVEEDELLVDVRIDQLVLHLGVDLGRDAHVALVGRREDRLEGHGGDGGVRGLELRALLGQPAWADNVRRRVGGVPGREEDVVLEVRRRDVGDLPPEGVDLGAHGRGQGHGGEDEEGAGGEFDYGGEEVLVWREEGRIRGRGRSKKEGRGRLTDGGTPAPFESAEAQEGHGESGDARRNVVDHHDLLWVGGDQLAWRHCCWGVVR